MDAPVLAALIGASAALATSIGSLVVQRRTSILAARLASELEDQKADLARVSKEAELRFQALHTRRAEILSQLHQLIHEAMEQAARLMVTIQTASSLQEMNDHAKRSFETTRLLNDAIARNSLYLEKGLAEDLKRLAYDIFDVISEFPLRPPQQPIKEEELAGVVRWWQQHRSDLQKASTGIEQEFRRLMGV